VQVDPLRAWRITCDFLLAFFDKHLLDNDAPLLDGQAVTHPEVRFDTPKNLLAY
jgi:hypothetical protein